LTLGQGWGKRQNSETGEVFRAFESTPDNPTELFLHHPPECSLIVEITAAAGATQTMNFAAAGNLVGQFEVTEQYLPQTIELPSLTENIVKLQINSDNPVSPVSVRRISLGLGPDCTGQKNGF
jgi:hypothetical protein